MSSLLQVKSDSNSSVSFCKVATIGLTIQTESRWSVLHVSPFRNDGRIGVVRKEVIWSTSSFYIIHQGIYVCNRRAFDAELVWKLAVDEVVMFLIARTFLAVLASIGMLCLLHFLRGTAVVTNRIATRFGDKTGETSLLIRNPWFITLSVIMRINNRLAATGLLREHGIMLCIDYRLGLMVIAFPMWLLWLIGATKSAFYDSCYKAVNEYFDKGCFCMAFAYLMIDVTSEVDKARCRYSLLRVGWSHPRYQISLFWLQCQYFGKRP